MSDLEFKKRVEDMAHAIDERTPKNWRCFLIIAEMDTERQSVICNLEEPRLIRALEAVIRTIKQRDNKADES